MKRLSILIAILCAVFLATAAPQFYNSGSSDVTFTDQGPRKDTVTIKAGGYRTLPYYIYDPDGNVTIYSHTTEPASKWPVALLSNTTISTTPVTVTQDYRYVNVYNGSGDTLTVHFNDDSTASKTQVIPNSQWFCFDNALNNIGTVHLTGSGASNVVVTETD